LINPVSKILILASSKPAYTWPEVRRISTVATFIAFVVLLVLVAAGNFILRKVFHVEIYSLQIVGGLMLFLIGMSAGTRGRFYHRNPVSDRMRISAVPMAIPLIVGPGTVVAAITFSGQFSLTRTMLALLIALLINYFFMLASIQLGKLFEKLHITEILIRITGLIVASVAVQMILNAIYTWVKSVSDVKT
jgi:multiple antibiotic resistance protein